MKQYRGLSYRREPDVLFWYVYDEDGQLLNMCENEMECIDYIDYIIDSEEAEESYNEMLHQADYYTEEY